MEQRDYLMKQFEQLAIIIAALMGLKQKGDLKRGLEVIAGTYPEIPGFDPSLLEENNAEEFLKKLKGAGDISFEKMNIIAGFIFEEADFLYLSGDHPKAKDRCEKALILFEYLDQNERIFSMERDQKISRIKKILLSFG